MKELIGEVTSIHQCPICNRQFFRCTGTTYEMHTDMTPHLCEIHTRIQYRDAVKQYAQEADYRGWALSDLEQEMAYVWTEIDSIGVFARIGRIEEVDEYLLAMWEGKLVAISKQMERINYKMSRNFDLTDGWVLIEEAKGVPLPDLIMRMGGHIEHRKFNCLHVNHREDDRPSCHYYQRTNSYYCWSKCKSGGTGIDLAIQAGKAQNSIGAAKWILEQV